MVMFSLGDLSKSSAEEQAESEIKAVLKQSKTGYETQDINLLLSRFSTELQSLKRNKFIQQFREWKSISVQFQKVEISISRKSATAYCEYTVSSDFRSGGSRTIYQRGDITFQYNSLIGRWEITQMTPHLKPEPSIPIIDDNRHGFCFEIDKLGFVVGGEFGVETYFVTTFSGERIDARDAYPKWECDRWDGRLEAIYTINKHIEIALLFNRVEITSPADPLSTVFGAIGLSGQYSYNWRKLVGFAGLSIGSWINLREESRLAPEGARGFYEVRLGVGYKLSNKLEPRLYLNNHGIYYDWFGGERSREVYTWYRMWSVGLSVAFYPWRS